MFFASAFVVFALVFFAGRAHADDATPTDPPAAQSNAPAADTSSTSSTPPPADNSSPPASDTSSTPAPAPAPDQTQSTPPANDPQSTPPPTGASAQPTPSTPAGADGPKTNNNQNATVGTTGTSLSNTGGNASGASGDPSTPAASGSGSTNGTVKSGTSDATGSNSGSAIDQSAQASTTDQGKVDILQIALVVNVGVAHSNSGANTVGADGSGSGGTGSTTANTKTGNASSTGDKSQTGVTQSAVLQPGDNSQQKAMVVNVGIAIGNTGLNITIGTMNGKSGQTLSSGNTTGQIASGNSKAIGDQSQSHITQKAGGMASGTATLTIDQRAIIVNFGTAFANTGGNFAFARFDPTGLTPEERDIVEAVLSVLAPFFAPQTGAPGGGTTTAKIGTGNATAVGNSSKSDVNQMAIGNLKGNEQASSHQEAVVGNLGIALANTGFNGSLANVPNGGLPSSNPELLAAQNALAQFLGLLTNLDWLNSPDPFAQFQQTVNLGGVTLELGGSLQGDDFMYGWDSGYAPDGGPIQGGVRVRQISGVINIGISTSDTGDNTVVAIVSANHDTSGKSLTSGNGIKNGAPDVLAQVLSGNATAIGNHSIVSVCQAFHDTVTCAPKTTPGNGDGGGGSIEGTHETPPPPEIQSASPVVLSASAHDPTLPFTGGAPQDLVEVAGALLGVGAFLSSRKRRERIERAESAERVE
jgi:hypothetical protein